MRAFSRALDLELHCLGRNARGLGCAHRVNFALDRVRHGGEQICRGFAVADAPLVALQVEFCPELCHAEVHPALAAREQMLKGILALKFDEIVRVLLDVLPVDKPLGKLEYLDLKVGIV